MHKVSDKSGTMEIDQVLNGSIDRSELKPDDVFLVDAGKHLFVWVGKSMYFCIFLT